MEKSNKTGQDNKELVRQLVYQVSYTKYHVLFYLWLIMSLLKHCKVPKYYDRDCSLRYDS